MRETWGRKWSYLEDWSEEERKLFWILVPTVPTIVFFVCIGIVYALGLLDHRVWFLILIGILFFLGMVGLAIRIGRTYNATRLTKRGYEKQKSAAIAFIISLIIMPVWLIPISIFTTQTNYSEVDPLLIDAGIVEDKSHLYYLPTQLVVLILILIILLQTIVLFFVIDWLRKPVN